MKKQRIKNFFTKLKQDFCNHQSNYTELEYNVNENHRRRIRRCDECGYGKERMEEAHKLLEEKDLPTNLIKGVI